MERKKKKLLIPPKESEIRGQKIAELWADLRSAYPDAKPWRIIHVIADELGMTAMGVLVRLRSMGLYDTKNHQSVNS